MAEQQLTYIHPYDDPDVIAGQGTIGMEILRQHTGALDALFVPVGGGGLMAGIAAYIKYLRPEIRLIAVEAEESACLAAALAKRRRVVLPQVGLFADGVAVAQIGQETFRVLRKSVDEVITVTTDEICAAIKDLFSDIRAIAEPAGALALAGLKQYVERNQVEQQTLMALLSGANVNFDRLRHIAERAELGERREAVLAVTIPERPGSFHAFCTLLGRRNITEFNYRYNDPQQARIFVGVEVNEGAPGEGARRPDREAAPPWLSGGRHDRQRDGQAAHPPHGRRPCHRCGRRAALPLRVSGAARRAAQLSEPAGRALEHHAVPLSQPWRGLWPGSQRHSGAKKRARQAEPGAGGHRLPLVG
jgi:threonine dehydratase